MDSTSAGCTQKVKGVSHAEPFTQASDETEKSEGLLSYGFWTMVFTHTLTHVFTYVHTTLFPVLKEEFHLSIQQLGYIAAIPPLCQTLLSIPSGLLSDRLGCRRLIIASLLMAIVGAFLAGTAGTPIALIIATSLVFMSVTVYHPSAYSYVTRLFTPQRRLKALGIHGAGGTLGVALGPLSISLLIGVFAFTWRQVYLFWIFPLLIGLIALFFVRKEPADDAPLVSANKENPPISVLPNTSLLSAGLVIFLIYLSVRVTAHSMSQSFMAMYLVSERGLSQAEASLYIGVSTVMGLFAASIGGFLAARVGEKRLLLIVLTVAYSALGIAILLPSNTWFVVLYLAYGFFSFVGMAANSAIMAKLSPGKKRGMAYALFFLPTSMMGAVGPMLAAFIAEALSISAILYVSVITFFFSLLILKFGVRVQPSVE